MMFPEQSDIDVATKLSFRAVQRIFGASEITAQSPRICQLNPQDRVERAGLDDVRLIEAGSQQAACGLWVVVFVTSDKPSKTIDKSSPRKVALCKMFEFVQIGMSARKSARMDFHPDGALSKHEI